MTVSGIEMGDAMGMAGDKERAEKSWREHLAERCFGNETGGSGERKNG